MPVGAVYVHLENNLSMTADRMKSSEEVVESDPITERPRQENIASKAALDMAAQLEEKKSNLYVRTRELTSRLGVLLKFLGPVSEVSPKRHAHVCQSSTNLLSVA